MQQHNVISTVCSSLAAVARSDAQVLILGSMPGEQSLTHQQYYAHPRNAFWYIMARLFSFAPELNYADKLLVLQQYHVALWDVIHHCERQGSLDSNIRDSSIVSNDFANFFVRYCNIRHIFFNGSRSYQEYQKRVLPNLAEPWQSLPRTCLPSTSPAMASLSFEQKLDNWMKIKQILLQNF